MQPTDSNSLAQTAQTVKPRFVVRDGIAIDTTTDEPVDIETLAILASATDEVGKAVAAARAEYTAAREVFATAAEEVEALRAALAAAKGGVK